jgi:hypothetical protein
MWENSGRSKTKSCRAMFEQIIEEAVHYGVLVMVILNGARNQMLISICQGNEKFTSLLDNTIILRLLMM